MPFIKIEKNNKINEIKNTPGDIIILHITHVYQKLWSHDAQFLRYAVQEMDGLTDKGTDRKSGIEKWVPYLQIGYAKYEKQPVRRRVLKACVCYFLKIHYKSDLIT